jgi:thiosulfate dehydrogenase [quinone] large subunit
VRARAEGWAIGGARILVGLMWLANIHWKVPPGFGEDTGGGLFKYSESGLRHSPFAPFAWVNENLVLENFRLFGWFTLVTEIALAGLLIIGYRTRWVALAGAAMSVPIMLSVLYYDRADEWSWSYLLMIGFHLLLWATSSGERLGLDGVLRAGNGVARRSLTMLGAITAVIGLLGLFVARSVDFAGRQAALLGSDAGFADGDNVVRRWELKFLWFNPMWALLTLLAGAMLIAGARRLIVAQAGAVVLALLAVVVFFQQTFDYLRDDGSVQEVATGSNVAVWGGFAVAGWLLARKAGAIDPVEPVA